MFNPGDAPKTQRPPAKIWELLRRNDAFRVEVMRLHALDKRATKETEEYCRVAREYNQAAASGDSAQLAALQQRLDQIKHRPIKSEACDLLAKHKSSHPLAALALRWLVPGPEFFIRCKRNGRVQEGRGLSPDLRDSSWSWRNVYSRGRKRARKVGGVPWSVRGPRFFADTLVNPFPDWQNWQRGETLFDFATAWNRLPNSFKRSFVSDWSEHYDSQSAYEFKYIHPPRETDIWSKTDLAKYLGFAETVNRHRLFAVSPTMLTTKSALAVFGNLRDKVRKGLPERREHLFGSEAAWRHYLARKERGLSLAEHIVGRDWKARESAEVTEQVRNQRKNVQYGVKAVQKLISSVYPAFDLKKAVLVHSAPTRKKRRKPKG